MPIIDLEGDQETPEKASLGQLAAVEVTQVIIPTPAEKETHDSIPVPTEKETHVVIPVPVEGDDATLEQPFKRPLQTLGSTATSALERLANANPYADVPMKRVNLVVQEIMAKYASPSVCGETPSTDMGSLVGPKAAREHLLRGVLHFRVPGKEKRYHVQMAQYHLSEVKF